MPEKLPAALNQVFTRRHEDEEAKHPRKVWALFKTIRIYYFYLSTIVNLSKRVSKQNCKNVTKAFLLVNTNSSAMILRIFLPLNTYVKFCKASFGGQKVRAHSLTSNRL